MQKTTWLAIAALTLAVGACGPVEIGDDGGAGWGDGGSGDGYQPPPPPPNAHVRGIVYAPNGTAFTPPLTVMGALVYLTEFPPAPIPQTVYCERCTDLPPSVAWVKTDEYGAFDLAVRDGQYLLVAQKGQFRIAREVTVAANQTLDVPAEDTTLPSRPYGDYDTIPRIALLTGSYDDLESLFAKLGLAMLSSDGQTAEWSSDTFFDVYGNGGARPPDPIYKGSANSLLTSLDLMKQYHLIFIPCSEASSVATSSQAQNNLRDYVRAGGKLYVADWSYDFMRQTWDYVHFDGGDGNPLGGANDTSLGRMEFTSHGHAVDQDLYAWLEAQQPGWGGDDLALVENWDWIMNLTEGYVGDMEGSPVYQKPDVIVEGPHDDTGSWKTLPPSEIYPLTIGFPYGCGRVLYTTYHTVGAMGGTHEGLLPQERILVYLILEIGVCQSGPVIE